VSNLGDVTHTEGEEEANILPLPSQILQPLNRSGNGTAQQA
jgi:hypothetical protein